ncbi:ASCH domain-containing protein [Mucilaginibacter dorajii]|uniref:ASCH domain-containing protein n=1 Tax=Mucilaginibacter dorajii TaxID=692994 RepID=A0ABP7QX16_9SPHI|nr:ASCH domain-containing protein [Mucilaginibacter dorajii]MCS3732452.1 putative transcriptional regulator [Mucilaginibacter dorajii]
MSDLILISVKEKYVKEMLFGRKTIELRKSAPKASAGDTLIIYTTQPKKAITAIAIVKQIIKCEPEQMWQKYHEKLGIDKIGFDEYYKNHKKAIGIEMSEVIALNEEILLSAIKLIHPEFTPPQTFKYLNKFTALRDFKHLIT